MKTEQNMEEGKVKEVTKAEMLDDKAFLTFISVSGHAQDFSERTPEEIKELHGAFEKKNEVKESIVRLYNDELGSLGIVLDEKDFAEIDKYLSEKSGETPSSVIQMHENFKRFLELPGEIKEAEERLALSKKALEGTGVWGNIKTAGGLLANWFNKDFGKEAVEVAWAKKMVTAENFRTGILGIVDRLAVSTSFSRERSEIEYVNLKNEMELDELTKELKKIRENIFTGVDIHKKLAVVSTEKVKIKMIGEGKNKINHSLETGNMALDDLMKILGNEMVGSKVITTEQVQDIKKEIQTMIDTDVYNRINAAFDEKIKDKPMSGLRESLKSIINAPNLGTFSGDDRREFIKDMLTAKREQMGQANSSKKDVENDIKLILIDQLISEI